MSKAARQRSARERLAAERRRQEARQKQMRLLGIVFGSVVAVAIIVVATVFILDQRGKSDLKAVPYSGPLASMSRQADSSIVMAKAGVTAPVLEVFLDFQCPACKAFEAESGDTLNRLAAEGKVKVVFRPFNLFQQQPLKDVSRRGANASFCVPADKWPSYSKTLFAHQPPEGTDGFENKDLINWGKDLGVTDPAFATCVEDMQKSGDINKATQYATNQKIESTPTVRLNGRNLDSQQLSKETLTQAIAAAQPAPSGSPSPTADSQ
jgi:protein-disulfide isomerase